MHKLIGVICLVCGVLLLTWTYNYLHTLAPQLHKVVFGSLPEKARYFAIAGLVLSVLGLFQIFYPSK
ncbi:MAG TPA: DUF3185 family protein [Dongiaceae bacterium]|jgi:hypothetical protein|nr:DUF3185 family protein [Dongiaceae bacterium]